PENKTWCAKKEDSFYQRYPKATMVASLAAFTALAAAGWYFLGGNRNNRPHVDLEQLENDVKILKELPVNLPSKEELSDTEATCIINNSIFKFKGNLEEAECKTLEFEGTSEASVFGKACKPDTNECWEGTYTYKDFKAWNGQGIYTGQEEVSRTVRSEDGDKIENTLIDFYQQGTWTDGKMQGLGSKTYGDKITFKGNFVDNVPNGFGILVDDKESIGYLGNMLNRQFQGYGALKYSKNGVPYVFAKWDKSNTDSVEKCYGTITECFAS
ncbi:MAG: hypothetical protein E6Q59_07050, partial [Nitrosomonas sp.]